MGGGGVPNNFSYNLVATGVYSDGTQQDLTQQVALQSSNSDIITIKSVTNQSVAYATSAGTANVSANYNGVTSNSLQLKAIAATLQSITINTTNNVTPQGYSSQVIATGVFSDGNNYDITKDVNFNSSDSSIASFDTAAYVDFG